jgi:hypothetical protein
MLGLLTPDKNDNSNNAMSSLSSSDAAAAAARKRKRSRAATAPRRSLPDRHGRGGGDDDEDVEFLPSLMPITRVLRPQPHQAELDESYLHSYRSDVCKHDGCTNKPNKRSLHHTWREGQKLHSHRLHHGAVQGQVCKKHGAKKNW